MVGVSIPRGILMEAQNLRQLVASSSKFQDIVGASGSGDAEDSILVFQAVEQYDPIPRAEILQEEWTRTNQGAGSWRSTGALRLSFEFSYTMPTTAATWRSSVDQFKTDVGTIMSEMEDLERGGENIYGTTHFAMERYSLIDGPAVESVAEREQSDPSVTVPSIVWWISFRVESNS